MKTPLCLLFAVSSQLLQAQTYFPATGNYYQVVAVKETWSQARLDAESTSYLGISGRLAVVTTQAENDFVAFSLLNTGNAGDSYWIGGWQPNGASVGASEGWTWIDGEPWSYTNWTAGEPNDFVGYGFAGEHALEMFNFALGGTWNDLADGNFGLSEGYIIEFATPEPTSLALLAVAAVGLVSRRKRTIRSLASGNPVS